MREIRTYGSEGGGTELNRFSRPLSWGRPYFVMDLVKGVPITEYCDRQHLSIRERLELMTQVCHAVQHAHQKGIIHRDLKPSNVLVAEYDGKPVPKIIDFGVAKATAQKLTEKTMFTEFGQLIGTFEYMSPEQARFNQLDVDTRSDIYSLGVLLYELLAGSTPLEKERLRSAAFDEILRMIGEEEPPRPSLRLSRSGLPSRTSTSTAPNGVSTDPGPARQAGPTDLATIAANRQIEPAKLTKLIRGELDWIVMKCLEKDRNRRYETASALAADLARYLADEPVEAQRLSRIYRLKKFIRRNKVGVVAGSAVGGALIAGLLLASIGFIQARRQAGIASAEAMRADHEARSARTQAARSEQVAQFLADMLEGAGPAVARGQDATLLTDILDKTADRIGTDLKDQPLVEAELRHTIGKVYSALGEYAKAEPMHGAAVALRKRALGYDSPEMASSLSAWSHSLWEAGQEAKAELAAREALAVQRKILGNQNLDVASSLHTLGFQLTNRGRLSEGEHILREGLAIRQKLLGDADPEVASALEFLAANLWRQNKFVEAETYCRQAIAIQQKAFGDYHPELANSLGTLSTILSLQRRLPEAENIRRQSLKVRRKIHPDYNFSVIHDFDSLNDLLLDQGKRQEAETNSREMLDILRKAVDSNPNKLDTINLLAWKLVTCPFVELRDPPRSVELAHQAVTAAPQNGNFWNTLGVAQYHANDLHGAIQSLRKSMELRAGGDPEDWFVLAMAYWQLGDGQSAREWYDKAAEWTDKNKPHIEEIRRFRAEAAELLGIEESKPTIEQQPSEPTTSVPTPAP